MLRLLEWFVVTSAALMNKQLLRSAVSLKFETTYEDNVTLFSYTGDSVAQQVNFSCQTPGSWNQDCDDFPDNPVRFSLNASNHTTFYASSSRGYWKSEGCESLQDNQPVNLSCFKRVPRPILKSQYPALKQSPAQYNNRIWFMSGAHTTNGSNLFALVHNEFHGDATHNTSYCSGQGQAWLARCWYANVILAYSGDGGNTWQLYQNDDGFHGAITSPQRYVKDAGRQGYTSQSNVVLADDGHFYALILNMVCGQARDLCPTVADPSLTEGVGLWRSENGIDWHGQTTTGNFSITGALNPYQQPYTPLSSYLPRAVLPPEFRFGLYQYLSTNTWVALGQTNTYNSFDNQTISTVTVAFTQSLLENWDLGPGGQGYCITEPDGPCMVFHWGSNPGDFNYPSLVDLRSPHLRPGFFDRNFQYLGDNPLLCYTTHHRQQPRYGDRNKDVVCQPLSITRSSLFRANVTSLSQQNLGLTIQSPA